MSNLRHFSAVRWCLSVTTYTTQKWRHLNSISLHLTLLTQFENNRLATFRLQTFVPWFYYIRTLFVHPAILCSIEGAAPRGTSLYSRTRHTNFQINRVEIFWFQIFVLRFTNVSNHIRTKSWVILCLRAGFKVNRADFLLKLQANQIDPINWAVVV